MLLRRVLDFQGLRNTRGVEEFREVPESLEGPECQDLKYIRTVRDGGPFPVYHAKFPILSLTHKLELFFSMVPKQIDR